MDAREMGVVSLSFPFLLDSLLAAGLPRRLLAASERSNRKDYPPPPILYHFSSFEGVDMNGKGPTGDVNYQKIMYIYLKSNNKRRQERKEKEEKIRQDIRFDGRVG